jgi:hypothetical protein
MNEYGEDEQCEASIYDLNSLIISFEKKQSLESNHSDNSKHQVETCSLPFAQRVVHSPGL